MTVLPLRETERETQPREEESHESTLDSAKEEGTVYAKTERNAVASF